MSFFRHTIHQVFHALQSEGPKARCCIVSLQALRAAQVTKAAVLRDLRDHGLDAFNTSHLFRAAQGPRMFVFPPRAPLERAWVTMFRQRATHAIE